MKMYTNTYSILGTNVRLETSSEKISDFCEFMWHEFLSDRPSTNPTVITALPSSKHKDCYSIYHDNKIAIDYGRELKNEPYFNITKILENIVLGYAIIQAARKNSIIPLHSGAVTKNNIGIIILGEENSGKSTLTLELVSNHGFLYCSDEVGLIDFNNNIHPFLKTISYTPGIVHHDKTWVLNRFGNEHHVQIPRKYFSSPTLLKSMFFVKYNQDAEPAITPLKKSDSLVRLLNSQIGMASTFKTIKTMSNIVKAVDSYQINHNNATKATQLIMNVLDNTMK